MLFAIPSCPSGKATAGMRHSVAVADDPWVSTSVRLGETFLCCPPDGNRQVMSLAFFDSEQHEELLSPENRT